jgi:acetylornithine deacetylase/succinyl-diaminopimelate desuccinylase-like protein
MAASSESELLGFVEQRRGDLIDFVARLVATPSVNPPGDERAVSRVVLAEMARLGLTGTAIAAQREERPNLVHTLRGARGKSARRLLYSGHLDTKPAGPLESWHTDPFQATLIDGQMYGLGTSDMKGGCAALVYALAALAACPGDWGGELVLALTADEEAGSLFGARYLAETCGLRADVCMIAEPGGVFRSWEVLPIVARGVCRFTIRVRGTQMHSSIMDRLHAVNASVEMARVLARMNELHFHYPPHPYCPGGLTLNAGCMVRGGVFYGMTSGQAEFASDLRILPGMTVEGVRRDIEAFLEQLRAEDPDLRAELVFDSDPYWLPAQEIPASEPFVGVLAGAAQDVLGASPPLGMVPYATDARFFQETGGVPTIPGFGPGMISVCHAPNEHVPIEDIVNAAKMYALAAWRYLADGGN